MRTYTWDEYYEKFYDWAESTQIKNLSALTGLGCADEVGEIIMELQGNISASNRLLKKAVEAKLAFSVYELIDFLGSNDEDVIIDICKKRKFVMPEDLREEEEEEKLFGPPQKIGLGGHLFAIFAGLLGAKRWNDK